MRKISIIITLLMVLPLLLSAKVNYLSEEEYKDLSKSEREAYWQRLENDRESYLDREAQAIKRQETARQRLEELRERISEVEEEHLTVYNSILDYLDVDKNNKADWRDVEQKINYFNEQINNFNSMSDTELWQAKKDIYALRDEWDEYREDNYAKIPDFREDINQIENRIKLLVKDMESKKPIYYEDDYETIEGDYLAKISGYPFIYDDPSKWGIIYRANRDQIKDPNILEPNMMLKIPRGKPNTWKVYKGECLWRISAYPEVYGTGTKWPVLYRANQDQIDDPDLIYPNQILQIPRD